MKMKSILSGLIVVCAACMSLAASYSQASNKPTQEPPMAIVSVRYIVDDVDTAIEFYTKLTELASVRFLIDHARAAVAFYTIHLGFPIALADGAIGITNGRARALVAAVVGLIGMILSVAHLGSSTGGFGSGSGRAGAIVALVLGLIGMNLGGMALSRSRRSRSAA
jgi:catechol 2,3-dioxygenase-like lactoylglutathione lyase family enzyme